MIGDMIRNREGDDVGMWAYRVIPLYLGMDRDGNPDYKFVLAEAPLLFRYPELQINICDN